MTNNESSWLQALNGFSDKLGEGSRCYYQEEWSETYALFSQVLQSVKEKDLDDSFIKFLKESVRKWTVSS